jgi:hypothetical protein
MRIFTAPIFFISLLLASPALASGTNLIPHANFDTSSSLTSGWGNLSAGKVWSSVDVDASSSSGSLLMINDSAGGKGILVWSGCVVVDEGQSYDYGVWHFTQTFQPGTGAAQVTVIWFASCSGGYMGEEDSETSSVEGVWTYITGTAEAPSGVGGAQLELYNHKTTGIEGDDREIYFDVAFLPEPDGSAAGFTAITVLVALTLLRRWRSEAGIEPAAYPMTSST